jgi:hypothetical protein
MGAGLVANSTRPVMHGVSVRVIGVWLGLQISKPDDKHGNANRGILPPNLALKIEQRFRITTHFFDTAFAYYLRVFVRIPDFD